MLGTGIRVPGGSPENPSSSNPVSAWVWLGAQAETAEKEGQQQGSTGAGPGHAGSPVWPLVSISARASFLLPRAPQEP